MIYVWSDLHLNHNNIIKYCDRPFKNVDEMNQHFFSIWEKTIKENDIIINLGDVGFFKKKNILFFKEKFEKMPGRKILVVGNHDEKRFVNQLSFNKIYNKNFQIVAQNGTRIIFSHDKMSIDEYDNFDINIHGHVHSDIISTNPKFRQVSVEAINYKPIELNKLLRINT